MPLSQMIIAILVGFGFGFVASMPIAGPIAALVFSSAAEGRMRSGFGIAVGAAVAESIYAALAFWGFGTLMEKVPWVTPASQAAAAVILFAIGIHFALRKQKEPEAAKKDPGSFWRGLLGGFLISALNPTLIATWSASVGMLFSTGMVDFHPLLAIPFAAGALGGIIAWFAILLVLVFRMKDRMAWTTVGRILRVMGVFLIGLAVWFATMFVMQTFAPPRA